MEATTQRIDKWLWFARIVKSRSLAAALVSRGAVRVNRHKIVKPSHLVAPGDVLTLAVRGRVRVLKVLDPGTRRGPATQARLLYEDINAPPQSSSPQSNSSQSSSSQSSSPRADRLAPGKGEG